VFVSFFYQCVSGAPERHAAEGQQHIVVFTPSWPFKQATIVRHRGRERERERERQRERERERESPENNNLHIVFVSTARVEISPLLNFCKANEFIPRWGCHDNTVVTCLCSPPGGELDGRRRLRMRCNTTSTKKHLKCEGVRLTGLLVHLYEHDVLWSFCLYSSCVVGHTVNAHMEYSSSECHFVRTETWTGWITMHLST